MLLEGNIDSGIRVAILVVKIMKQTLPLFVVDLKGKLEVAHCDPQYNDLVRVAMVDYLDPDVGLEILEVAEDLLFLKELFLNPS